MFTAHPQRPDEIRAETATLGGGAGVRCGGWRVGALAGAAALLAVLALPAGALAQTSFAGPTNFAAGDLPEAVAVGDFDGDSVADLAVANQTSDNVSVLLGRGDGSFDSASNFPAGTDPRSVAVGDFDGDQDSDLAVPNQNSGSVAVLLGKGDGSFGPATNFDVNISDSAISVAVGDFDGDSDPDLAIPNRSSDEVSVLLGNGDGSFGTATNFAVGGGPEEVAVGDFDGDSDHDLAVANRATDNVSVLHGNGDGSFGTATNFAAHRWPAAVAVGDFDRDSDPDLAVANETSDNVSVLLGNGDGSFGTATNFAAGNEPASVAVGDFDGDSDPDLAVANMSDNNVSVLLGKGDGSFGPATNFAAGDGPSSVAVGDFDGDSDPDLAVANFRSANVSVLLNNRSPSAAGDAYATDEDTQLSRPGPGVLGNDTDPDGDAGDALTAVLVSGPAHAASFALSADGSFTYTPTAGYNGPDSFTYRASDGALESELATVAITVVSVNDAPAAAADAYATDEDTPLGVDAPGVLGNDSDVEGDALGAVLVSGPEHGSLELNSDGSFSYTPDRDYHGPDSFSYRAGDGSLDSDPVTVTIEVRPLDDPPPPAGPASTPPVDAAPDAGSAAPPERAITQLRLNPRCVRSSRSGRVRIRMSLRMAQPRPLQIRIDRAIGGGVGRNCPSPNPQRRFTGRFERVATLSQLPSRRAAAAATVVRRLTLKHTLSPGLYRITVRAKLDHGRLSRPARRYLRVLG
jgi:predicted NUDIX family NTP pyrophosphohydrolase